MPIKDDLLQKGYLPENIPPCFQTTTLGANLAARTHMLSDGRSPVRSTPFNASKRGMARREFSFVHPATAHDLAEFISVREAELTAFFATSTFSMSRPNYVPDGDRAIEISSHPELEQERLTRLSRFRFIARTDISRFYHSIYTHSIPWAIHGKPAAKADRSPNSTRVYTNRLDMIVRSGQDGQTIGIPVGPDASRYLAEIIGTGIDQEFVTRGGLDGCELIRHVDDVWIGADSHADAEAALWRYREAIRSFELDINDSKTAIYSNNFTFTDVWPSDVAAKIEFAISSTERRIPERLRAALEYAFHLTAQNNDDGVLKYTLRFIDRNNLAVQYWEVIEPFLKRSASHFGHTIDYVARIIVWRHLAFRDLNIPQWSAILHAILNRHGRLGNDSEVSWALYASIRLNIPVPPDISNVIIQNCGPLSVLATLSSVQRGLVDRASFATARDVISTENAAGTFWPLILEWHSQQWPDHNHIEVANDLIADLVGHRISLFDADQLPLVFQDVDEDEFESVTSAIEQRSSQYDADDDFIEAVDEQADEDEVPA